MSKLFFDMIMIKNLDVMKLKNAMESQPQKIMEKEEEISKLKIVLERKDKEVKECNEKRNVEKKKY